MYTTQGVVARVWAWQHTPDLTQPRVMTPNTAQVEAFQDAPPAGVQTLTALQEQGVEKVTYQIGGLNLVLAYVERVGLAEAVDRRCLRNGTPSEGTAINLSVQLTSLAAVPFPTSPCRHRIMQLLRYSLLCYAESKL